MIRSFPTFNGRLVCTLHWRHNDHDGVSNHQPHDCLLNRLFRRRSKKTPKLRVTSLCAGISPGPANSPQKGPVTRKMFPFDDVILKQNKTHQSTYLVHDSWELFGHVYFTYLNASHYDILFSFTLFSSLNKCFIFCLVLLYSHCI